MTSLPLVSPARARAILDRFADRRVLVVGDVMLDRFIIGRVTRISPEAPVPVVRFERESVALGGAANVAANIAALGARVSLIGLVGRDASAERVREALAAAGLAVDGLVEDEARPTVEKTRIVTDRHQHVARIDYEDDADAGGAIERQLVERIAAFGPSADVLLVSDYSKGAVTGAVMTALRALKTPAVALVVDPKIPHIDHYAGATLVTPNHVETEEATHLRIRTDDDARDAALAFRQRARCDAVLVTRGEHGMWLSSDGAEGAIQSMAREVSDVTGAGDTVVATVSLALAAGATLAEASALANHAAGVVVAKFGPATVTCAELLDAVDARAR